jgi:hypothetical protein
MLRTTYEATKQYCHRKVSSYETIHQACEGQYCMAWRWAESIQALKSVAKPLTERKGYCGLVGKPEFAE